jgi:hypothetical protein
MFSLRGSKKFQFEAECGKKLRIIVYIYINNNFTFREKQKLL